jgi:malate dehydrogenase|tara:strand:- start:599 stop:1168 length:570 start_codon:yes stop_codon:yes gene_type:complete
MAFQKYSGLPTNKVVGMAGILDSSRFKYFISQELKVPVKNVESLVLGGHGDTMVPMTNQTTVSGKPLNKLIQKEKLDSIIERTRKGGAEIGKLLQKGSAFYAPASSGIEMAESYIKDLKKTLPCAAYLNGEYGVRNLYAGVPVVIGNLGAEKVIEIKLDDKEKENFEISIKAVKELFEAAIKIDPDLAK